jgi:hypothetical protein
MRKKKLRSEWLPKGPAPTLPPDARGVAFKMSDATIKTLDAWAQAEGITRNDLLRRELDALAARRRAEHPEPAPVLKRRKKAAK